MNIKRISEFCDDTLGDVVADLQVLKMKYMTNTTWSEEEKNIMVSCVDMRIAAINSFFEEVRSELRIST